MHKYLLSFIAAILLIALMMRAVSDTDDTPIDDTYLLNSTSLLTKSDTVNDCRMDDSINLDSLEIPFLEVGIPDQRLIRRGYTTSYNHITRNPNWVGWHLTREKTEGPFSRDGIDYVEDLEAEINKQYNSDWDDCPQLMDHGHLCPAGDNKWDKEAMLQSFLLTNISPQHQKLNRGAWERLERRCRGWAKQYGDIYITTGPVFYSSDFNTMGENRVGIPDAFFKVILRTGKKNAAIGFVFPNKAPMYKYQHYALSVDEVENITGLDFFHLLPDSIETIIESQSDINHW